MGTTMLVPPPYLETIAAVATDRLGAEEARVCQPLISMAARAIRTTAVPPDRRRESRIGERVQEVGTGRCEGRRGEGQEEQE